MNVRRVFSRTELAEDPGAVLVLDGEASHYVRHVLRMQVGARVEVFDELGHTVAGEVISRDGAGVRLRIDQSVVAPSPTEAGVSVSLWVGLTKGRKLDDVVRRTTELGVDRLVPVLCERSVARPDPERVQRRVERWRRIAGEAARQCGRSHVPGVQDPLGVEDALDSLVDEEDSLRLLLFEGERRLGLRQAVEERPAVRRVSIAVGPEGGWSAGEVERFKRAGFSAVSLGPRILRAETAPLVVLACVQLMVGELG